MLKSKKTKNKKYPFWVILGFVVALTLRVIFLPYGNHNDLITNTGWSEWIYLHGPKGFYENNVWVYDSPTQLPLINLIYYFNYIIFGKSLAIIAAIRGVLTTNNILLPWLTKHLVNFETWFGWTYYGQTPYMTGHVLSMKIIPILADMVIAAVIYLIGLKFVGYKKALITALIYLFIPYTFYISALWGQYDQLSALGLLLSFYFVYLFGMKKQKLRNFCLPLSIIFYFLAVEVKPTVAFTLPFYIFCILKQKPSFLELVVPVALGVGLFFVTTFPFASEGVLKYTFNTIYPKVMFSGRNVLSTQAFNFWELVSPLKVSSLEFTILGVKGIVWGYIFLVGLNILAIFIVLKKNDLKHMLLGLFVVTGGSYIFATGMLDRYYFAGLLIFLVLTMFYEKIIWLWLAAAVIFSINLFTSWGYPVNLQIHDSFWSNYPLVRVISFVQVIIFLLTIIMALRQSKKDRANCAKTNKPTREVF